MARMKGLIPPQSSRFADIYDIYVDYGKGQPIQMNNNESIFIDVEKFLFEQNNQTKSNAVNRTNLTNKNKSILKNRHTDDSTISSKHSSIKKSVRHSNSCRYDQGNPNSEINYKYCSTFTPVRSHPNSSSFPLKPKIIYDDGWFSNKQYNARVAAFIDHVFDKFNNDRKPEQISDRYKPSRTSTYQVPTGQLIHERIYPTVNRRKLGLSMAVNGASKSMREELPSSNISLKRGDFGDDAGMNYENRDYCFVGLADGAGGNRSFGINPADFSRAVLAACRNILHQNNFQSNQLPRLIISAMQQVEASDIRGSSTLCLLSLDKKEHTLTSLNIGDSGFIIYRDNQIYHQSTCTMSSNGGGPRQLFALNSTIGIPCFINENELRNNCSLETIKVQKNDIIILSSDGLWDVIENDELQKIIKRNANNNLQDLADDLLNRAIDGYFINGRDDILIIVCRVDELGT